MLERVASIEQYQNLISDTKKRVEKKALFTNCYLQNDQIERYIQLQRFYYLNVEAGIVFISDEETYYKAFYYLNSDLDFEIKKMEKPILVRNLYVDGCKKDKLLTFEKKLEGCGFVLHDTTCQVIVDKGMLPEIEKKAKAFERVLKKGKFVMSPAEKEQLEQIFALRDSTGEFNLFTFYYMTEDEHLKAVENGEYSCICDENGNVCATHWFEINNKFATGNGLCVREDKKTVYGLGAAITLKVLADCFNRGVEKYYGWVIKTDEVSKKFHENIGFVNTGKAEDDWVLW